MSVGEETTTTGNGNSETQNQIANESTNLVPNDGDKVEGVQATALEVEKPEVPAVPVLILDLSVVRWALENPTKLADLVAAVNQAHLPSKSPKDPRIIQGSWERVISNRPEFAEAVSVAVATGATTCKVELSDEDRTGISSVVFKRGLRLDALVKDIEKAWSAVLENVNK
jgi:hypothetical protein